MSTSPLILVSNDDGVRAEGIFALASAMASLGRVVVVAPSTDQSAVSHAMSLRRPLRINKHPTVETEHGKIAFYSVDGTPTDAVYMAIHEILNERPQLVVAGINHGANLGDDVLYSGTVSAAMEGSRLGIPAVAFSLVAAHTFDFSVAAQFARSLCKRLLQTSLPPRFLLNVNIPKYAKELTFETTSLGKHGYEEGVDKRIDLFGEPYYWIGGKWGGFEDLPGTDCAAISRGRISVTPLQTDLTASGLLTFVDSLQR